MSTIDEVKARIDIIDLVSETVKLRRAGKNYSGFCPFHANTRTPAFVVFPDTGTWRCFGECNEGGDIFRFVMKREGWDFGQALRHLAERAGVELEPMTPEKQEADEYADKLRDLLEQAALFYQHQLLRTPAGAPALTYLQGRGLKNETITTFGLGYAPDGWDAAQKYLLERGWSAADLLEAGLVSERDSGGYYDRLRNRILFPIRDAMGKLAGFGARILNPEDVPKFLNSPQTRLFDKGRMLYGLDLARKAIRAENQAVIVEGYLDVIALHQEGFTNAVSPMGTALTEAQFRLLKRFTQRIVLALDADSAGEKATLRGLEVARQAMDHSAEIGFDPRGLLRQEARLQADLRVTTLPEGQDPDDVVLRDPEEWRRILAAAQPVVVHVMETLAAARDIDDPKAKSEIATQVLPLIADVPNSVEREAYRQRLARLLKVDERALIGSGSAPARQRPRRQTLDRQAQPAQPAAPIRPPSFTLEQHILRMLLVKMDALYMLDRVLLHNGLARFSPEDLEYAPHQQLGRLIFTALEQDEVEPEDYLKQHLPEELTELVNDLNKPFDKDDLKTETAYIEELVRSVLRWRQLLINQGLSQLHHLQQEVQDQGETTLTYQELVMQYTQTLSRLNRALASPIPIE
ncbi:MAG: DNA primase [Anaerolineae bacterium]|nr:DNA primase [Anaerolineae bacterium]